MIPKQFQHPKYWLTLVWAGAIVQRARKEGRIKEDFGFHTILKEINQFRIGCGTLMSYDWISVPLVYTQVVTLAVYSFFLASLLGRQFLDPEKNYPGQSMDLVVPIFTFLQFFFYMGWLKVAEALINPFGEDDDDFESNFLIDRNLQVAYLIVDEMHAEHPELVKDHYWDEGVPDELPYTLAAEETRTDEPWTESTAGVTVGAEQAEFTAKDDDEEDDIKTFDPCVFKESGSEILLDKGKITTIKDSREDSNGSIFKMFSSSVSRNDLPRIESGVSIMSSVMKNRRKRSIRNVSSSHMSDRKSSHPFLRRIPTDVSEFHKLSESSSDSEEEGQLKIKGYPLDDIKEIEVKKHIVQQEEELIDIIQNKEKENNQEHKIKHSI